MFILYTILYSVIYLLCNNEWGLGLGIGDWGLGPIPNPQSPIPNPHIIKLIYVILYYNIFTICLNYNNKIHLFTS